MFRSAGTAIPMTANFMSRPEPQAETTRWPSPPDPGDLSRRIAQRRAELHLSQAQVAARAGLSLRYLEYLERYPARPAPAALQAARRGAADHAGRAARRGRERAARPAAPSRHAFHQQADAGRVPSADRARRRRADRVQRGLRPGRGAGQLRRAGRHHRGQDGRGHVIDGHADEQVALEVDHIDEALCQGWSVLVRGPAHRVAHPAELHRLQEDAAVWPWPGGEREVYVRIVPREITGRRIELRPAP